MLIRDIPIQKADDEQRIVWGWANLPQPGEMSKALDGGSIEEHLHEVSAAYRAQFSTDDDYAYIVATYPSYLIACRETTMGTAYYQHAYVMEGDSVAFGAGVEVEQVWVEKALADARLSDPASVDERAKVALGKQLLNDVLAALRGKVDLQDDVVPLAELEKAAYAFMLGAGISGVDHERDDTGAKRATGRVVESFLATTEKYVSMGIPVDMAKTYPQGWFVGFKILDDEVWKGVKDGTYRAFSVGGNATRSEITS